MPSAMVRVASPGRQALQLVISAPLDLGREGDGLLLADDRVSRRHARLEASADGGIEITDLGSANGVIVDGCRITEPVIVPVGGSAVVGDTRIDVLSQSSTSSVGVSATMIAMPGDQPTTIERVANEVGALDPPAIMRIADEPGTLTIAFSDIEASTEHAVAVGDTAWFKIMNNHNEIVERRIDQFGGRIVRNQGDGFMMCFRSARLALHAAIETQRDLAALEESDPDMAVRVRIGLHTGEVLQDDEGDLFGRHVLLAARIGDLADGRQILVSSILKQITEPRGDLTFGEPVMVQLKGLETAQVVHDVDWRHSAISASAGDQDLT